MKPITEQDIWDLLDGNCSQQQTQFIQQQLQLEENAEWLQLYETFQVLNSDLQSMSPAEPSAHFNATVLAKLEVAKVSQMKPTTSAPNLSLWNPISKWTLIAIGVFGMLAFLLQYIAPTPTTETMGWGGSIIDGLTLLIQLARNPFFVGSIGLIYILGLLTLLDTFLKRRFHPVHLSKR